MDSEHATEASVSTFVTALEEEEPSRSSIVTCLRTLLARGELYRGVGSICTTLATSSFIFFYLNEYGKRLLKQRLLISCLAGTINVLLTNPLWVANLKVVAGEADSLWSELRRVARREGIRPLWKGTGTSILLVSNPVLQFFGYDLLRRWQLVRGATHLSPARAFWTGALAKAMATVATYPLQLTQSVLRMQSGRKQGIMECLMQLYKRKGAAGLYTGMRAKLLQTVLTAAFTFLTYEQILGAVHAVLLKNG